MYTTIDFPTKKALKEAVAAFLAGTGPAVTFYQPGGYFPAEVHEDNKIYLEGPHYPKPHSWYAVAWVEGGVEGHIIKVQ
jgi:hypothetical protein